MRSWSESGLTSELLKAVEKAGYKKPSPIQMAAIPIGLQQRDVIGIAETGGEGGGEMGRKEQTVREGGRRDPCYSLPFLT